jgi:hypothetical protein
MGNPAKRGGETGRKRNRERGKERGRGREGKQGREGQRGEGDREKNPLNPAQQHMCLHRHAHESWHL